jgi:hypothetical protein
VKARPNAVLVLRVDTPSKLWVNGIFRGRATPKAPKRVPVVAGDVVIKLKSDAGVVKRFVKRVKARSKASARVHMSRKGKGKRAKARKANRKARKATKEARKAHRKARKATKEARKANRKARKASKRAGKAGKRAGKHAH